MIRNTYAENFQRLASANLRLAPVTVLAGPNGAGKTSVAEAIEFALLGTSPRGGTVDEVRRVGEDAAEVELVLDDDARTKLGRRVTRTTHVRVIDEEKASDKAFAKAVEKHVGDTAAIRAAFDSRRLFEPKFDLQGFLVGLTGARFDAATIRAAFDAEVVEASERLGLRLPGSLADFGDEKKGCEAAARERRIAAKRVRDEREADLERLPPPAIDVGERPAAAIEQELRKVRAEHQLVARAEAESGAEARARHEERIALLRAAVEQGERELAEARAGLEESVTRPVRELDRELDAERKKAARAEASAESLRRQIAELEAQEAVRDGDEALAAQVDELALAEEKARRAMADSVRTHERLQDQCADAKEALASAPAGGTCSHACEHCTVANAQASRDALARKLEQIAELGKAAAEDRKRDEAAATAARERLAEAKGAAARVDAARTLASARAEQETTTATAKAARDAEAQLVAELDLARKVAAARALVEDKAAEVGAKRAELDAAEAAPLPAVPETSAASLAERVATLEQHLESARARDRRAEVLAAAEKARAEATDADLIAKALGKDGARAALIAAGCAPFVDAVNQALAHFAPGWAVELDGADFGIRLRQGEAVFRPEQLSDGHRTRLLYVLQVAIARLARVGLVVFDRAELLDTAGREGLDELVTSCVGEGIQVLLLVHGEPPLAPSDVVGVYAVEEGVARRWGAPAPRAAPEAGVSP